MHNKSMQKMLIEGEALDVRREGREIREGVFALSRFVEGKDYCDSARERWIWSVGRNLFDGRIEASGDSRYHGDASWECLYLR